MENMFTRGAVLAIALLLCSMLIIGCTQSQQAASGTQPEGSGGTVDIAGKVNSSMSDNRTAYDKNQTTIAGVIADGTYAGDIEYKYHSGDVSATVSLTVESDTITSASVVGNNADNVSTMIIGKFNAALPDLVVGKKINELSIPKNVAGSSLTTAAFKLYVDGLVASQPAQG